MGNATKVQVDAAVIQPAGTITMGYDVLGRLTSRTTGGSSSATWDYVTLAETQGPNPSEPAADLGLLRSSSSTTHTSLADLKTVTSAVYDPLHRPVSSTTTLPISPLLGDLSGKSYETKMVDATGAAGTGYDALGQAINVTLPAMGGLPAETITTGLRKSGVAQTLTLTSAGNTTALVTGVTYSGTGQLTSRSYGNGATRNYTWSAETGALTGLSASFVTSESGSAQTVSVQNDTLTRDVMGRIVTSTSAVPVIDGTTVTTDVTAECFTYDGFNRLSSAWTVVGTGPAACGTDAVSDPGTSVDLSSTAYAAKWTYSDSGQISNLVKGAAGAFTTSTYAYDPAHPAAVTSVSDGTTTDSFTYDAAGRMVSRTVDGVTTALTWDVTSSLVESDGQGGHVVYAYDAGGQRVAQATVARPGGGATGEDLPGTATAYVASGQVEDPNTATTSTGDVTATRYYTFGGSTVAVRTNDNKLALMLGDEQGSTSVVMPVTVQPGGGLASATLADAAAVTRTAYTPYGELRGEDNPAVDRGWLGQVEDRVSAGGTSGTGLTYLNARYYDPATSRFISPDPLMNPGDPRTLDPYRYADNNPVVFTDATGLASKINQIDGVAGKTNGVKAVAKHTVQTKGRAATVQAQADHKGGGRIPLWINLAPTKEAKQSPWDFYIENESIALHGIVNFGGGIVNGASSMINGALATSGGGMAYMAITGTSTPAIPTIPIWGDYDMYKYSSWSGSGAFFVGSLFFGGGEVVAGSRAAVAVEEAVLPVLQLSASKMPNIVAGIARAFEEGAPTVLTRVESTAARANRAEALSGAGPRPAGMSWDEFPFASTAEGGAGAWRNLVPVSEQNIQGGVMAAFYKNSGIESGMQFLVELVS